MIEGEVNQKSVLALLLPSISAIAAKVGVEKAGQEIYQESSDFTAERHVYQFEDAFNLFNTNYHQLCVAQLAGNCSLNNRIAELMEIPHVVCLS